MIYPAPFYSLLLALRARRTLDNALHSCGACVTNHRPFPVRNDLDIRVRGAWLARLLVDCRYYGGVR